MSFKEKIKDHQNCIEKIVASDIIMQQVDAIITLLTEAFSSGRKVLLCGNGGSAADAEHLAAELSGRFAMDRPPLNADALHSNASALTAIANDYNYNRVYSRLLEAKGQPGDILIAISTSGHSKNVLQAIHKAKEIKMHIISISGELKNEMGNHSDIHLIIPSDNTARIQESYMLLGHIICEAVEKNLFS